MPKYISDYSRNALEREYVHSLYNIYNYSRNNYSYGCTTISYSKEWKDLFIVVRLLVKFFCRVLNYFLKIETRQHVYTHYFYTKTGEELGSSKEDAIKRSVSLGEEMMKVKKYSEASSYFDVACNLCGDSRWETFDEKRHSAMEELRREREEKERREQEEKERMEREAADFFQKAQEKWNEALELENKDSGTEARGKFDECNKLFQRAMTILPNRQEYSVWFNISTLKLKDDSFSKGLYRYFLDNQEDFLEES